MNKKDSKAIDLKSLWVIFLTVAVPLIGVSGATYIPYTLRPIALYLNLAIAAAVFVLTDARLRVNLPTLSFFLLISYIAISFSFSLDSSTTLTLLINYLCCFPMLFIRLEGDTVNRIFKIIYVISIVFAFSIIISAPINNCMNRYFWFIVNPTRSGTIAAALTREISLGSYSGFAREMGEAAFIQNMGIAVSFSKFFTKGKLTPAEAGFLGVQLVALLLTGKRTYFLVSLVCFLLFFLFSKTKGKLFKLIAIVSVVSLAAIVIMTVIPQTSVIFNKLLDAENMEKLGGRAYLWPYIFKMIEQYWLFGCGFGSYNLFAFNEGFLSNGKMWTYNAHNCYLQILGELGVIGFSLLIIFIISSLYITIAALRTERKQNGSSLNILYFSLYVQILMLVYAFTGNPLYTKHILFMWLFSVGLSLNLYNQNKPAQRSLIPKGAVI